MAASNSSRALRASADSCLGTATSRVTSRSVLPLEVWAPFPRSRTTLPDDVPGFTLILLKVPSKLGTSTTPPKAASFREIGTLRRRSLPSCLNTGWGRTLMLTTMSPASPPSVPGRPLPRRRIFCPSLTPAGIRTLTARPSAVISTMVPLTASRNSSVASVTTSWPRLGREKLKLKGPGRPSRPRVGEE